MGEVLTNCGTAVILYHVCRLSSDFIENSVLRLDQLMLCGEIMAVDCENHAECMNTLCGQNAEF